MNPRPGVTHRAFKGLLVASIVGTLFWVIVITGVVLWRTR
jgi:hypothetical protein